MVIHLGVRRIGTIFTAQAPHFPSPHTQFLRRLYRSINSSKLKPGDVSTTSLSCIGGVKNVTITMVHPISGVRTRQQGVKSDAVPATPDLASANDVEAIIALGRN
ncbi:hypothetical protein, partial [Ferrovum sp.]|uniref:hypothetical protein n=1 Tax=Ferrovum sp. TaxID=2609467 RepID=UPI00262C5F6E